MGVKSLSIEEHTCTFTQTHSRTLAPAITEFFYAYFRIHHPIANVTLCPHPNTQEPNPPKSLQMESAPSYELNSSVEGEIASRDKVAIEESVTQAMYNYRHPAFMCTYTRASI